MSNPVSTPTLGLLEKLAAFTARRHEVLTANVAHATTPGYERRDLDVNGFESALKEAVDVRRGRVSAAQVRSRYPGVRDPFAAELFTPTTDAERNVRFQDGGVRSIETEMTELTRNTLMHSFAVEIMKSQFGMLEAVISERP